MKTLFSLLLLALPVAEPSLPMIDLTTPEGVALINGQWRYSDTRIVETDFRRAGPTGQATGDPVKTYDYTPHAGAADFDDSKWEAIAPSRLSDRRGHGRLSFNWYRTKITIPQTIGSFDPSGSTAVFETSVDDYAEIWVDGELTRGYGQSGGSVVGGWNTVNRVVIGRNVKPGQQIQLAIFGANGPLSNPPTNFIFVRLARLRFEAGAREPAAITPVEVNVSVDRRDPDLDDITGPNLKIFKIAEGFDFTEGPVWTRGGLNFSDPNTNTIYRYENGALTVLRRPSGYDGVDARAYHQPGANGLALDPQGRLTINQHGNRRVIRLDQDGFTVLADRWEGKRLNSPNDLVYRSDGTLFFTDPPFGLPEVFADPRKELDFSGVYSLRDGKLQLLERALTGPNGIALSPDEKTLYVGNWDDKKKVVMRYDLRPDGTVANGRVFHDLTPMSGEDAIDGVKVDERGNVYVSGPGGLWIVNADGKLLGAIMPPKHPHNFAWGDDGKTLYLCARSGLYRMPLLVRGAHFKETP